RFAQATAYHMPIEAGAFSPHCEFVVTGTFRHKLPYRPIQSRRRRSVGDSLEPLFRVAAQLFSLPLHLLESPIRGQLHGYPKFEDMFRDECAKFPASS